MLEAMAKKFGARSPKVWTNYAHYLHHTRGETERARGLLRRATQQLDKRHHVATASSFAALEFLSAHGEAERGRTMFAGLLDAWPKKGDVWSQLLELEMRHAGAGAGADAGAVRDVFARRTRARGLKAQQAERWFRRWAEWEAGRDGEAGRERVMARAREWAAAYKARRGGEGGEE